MSRGRTAVERRSERELVVTRTFDAPARLLFDAWTKPELFLLWWAPKSSGVPMRSCEMDVRAGGGYRIVFGRDEAHSRAFFGKYLEVSPPSRLVWTNDEGDQDGAISTVTFEDVDGKTLLTLQELYPSKEALDQSFVGMEDAAPEQFDQLDELLATLGAV
ncbi:MAG TPA: SRPBCC family protein [Caulobacteraceae bacterium]|jgi:uncharacterized protein YndB with AHSA1/START domain